MTLLRHSTASYFLQLYKQQVLLKPAPWFIDRKITTLLILPLKEETGVVQKLRMNKSQQSFTLLPHYDEKRGIS